MKQKRRRWAYRLYLMLHGICLLIVVAVIGFVFERVALSPALASELHPKKSFMVTQVEGDTGSAADMPAIDPDDWKLQLVNQWSPLPDGFDVDVVEVERGYQFDARAADKLRAMLEDCRDAGLQPLICSAYRTHDYQTGLFERQIEKQKAKGLARQDAIDAAGQVVAVPGTSEHELGLAVDICALDYQLLDEGQEDTPEYQWLKAHCTEYGFILRYPPDTTEITGIIYEPWHFRYVGKQAAVYITSHNLTLEEYLQQAE